MLEPEVEVVASTTNGNVPPNASAPTTPPNVKSTPTDARTVASEARIMALNTIKSADPPSGSSFPAIGAMTIHYDSVDITLPFFKDLLSDKPIAGANAIRSLAPGRNGSQTRAKRAAEARHGKGK